MKQLVKFTWLTWPAGEKTLINHQKILTKTIAEANANWTMKCEVQVLYFYQASQYISEQMYNSSISTCIHATLQQ